MENLTREELKWILDNEEDFVIMNVLPRERFEKQHIEGSINIPIVDRNFDKKVLKRIPDKNKRIVVHCASIKSNASPRAAKRLIRLGYNNVIGYGGGIKEFCSEYMCASEENA